MNTAVTGKDYTLVDISNDGCLNLIAEDTSFLEDVKLPGGDLGDEIRSGFEQKQEQVIVTVENANGQNSVVAVKKGSL